MFPSHTGRIALVALALGVALPAAAVTVSKEIIDSSPPTDPWMKASGDLDGDNRVDFVVAGRAGPVVWYRGPQFQKFTIAEYVTPASSSTDVDVFDLDGDGYRDVVLANGVWYENPAPADMTQPWVSHQYGSRNGHDVWTADIDREGDLDLVTRHQQGEGQTIYTYLNDPGNAWREIAIQSVPAGEGLALGDLDRDGDADIAITDRWYENTGPLNPWTARLYDGVQSSEPDDVVVVADVDRDGRLDVVTSPAEAAGQSGSIVWFRAPANARTTPWERRVLRSNVSSTHHSLLVLDWDLDGDLDVATARMQQDSNPAVQVLLNNGTASNWPIETVDTKSSHNMQAADVDQDTDLDLVGSDWNTADAPNGAPLRLWRSQAAPEPGAVSSLLSGALLLASLHRAAHRRRLHRDPRDGD